MRKCGCGGVTEKVESFKMFLVEEGERESFVFKKCFCYRLPLFFSAHYSLHAQQASKSQSFPFSL